MGKLPRALELAWIDGLRAIAVGLVIAYHCHLVFADGTPVVGGGFVDTPNQRLAVKQASAVTTPAELGEAVVDFRGGTPLRSSSINTSMHA